MIDYKNTNAGDLVTYRDIANQDGAVWEVIALPNDPANVGPTGYVMSDFMLRDVNNHERTTWSDLRQRGWTIADERAVDYAEWAANQSDDEDDSDDSDGPTVTADQVRANAALIARTLTECAQPGATQYTDFACIEAMLNACGVQMPN